MHCEDREKQRDKWMSSSEREREKARFSPPSLSAPPPLEPFSHFLKNLLNLLKQVSGSSNTSEHSAAANRINSHAEPGGFLSFFLSFFHFFCLSF